MSARTPFEVPGPTTHLCGGIDQRYLIVPEFMLESGHVLVNVPVAFKTWGQLNSTRDNVLLVCHPISGSADVADWWGPLFGPGHMLDPERYFIVCCNTIGSPYGTASPLTRRGGEQVQADGSWACAPHVRSPSEPTHWGADFPNSTVRDDVRLHKLVLDYLGVEQLAVVLGGSMGGMASLEWPLCFPVRNPRSENHLAAAKPGEKPYVRSTVLLATAARHSGWCIAWSETQRTIIQGDARFHGGHYRLLDQPASGLSAARMCALMTYRQPESFERRFSRMRGKQNVQQAQQRADPQTQASSIMEEGEDTLDESVGNIRDAQEREQYAVQSYLKHHGNKFVQRFDALCYIHLTHKLDSHDIARERASWVTGSAQVLSPGDEEVLAGVLHKLGTSPVAPRVLVLSVTSDMLYTPQEQLYIHHNTPRSQFVFIESSEGHDGFLLEYPQIERAMLAFRGAVEAGFATL